MQISYDYYRVFYHVAKFRSFTRAAEVLLSNQPNVTRAVKNLESALGCTLFVRSNRGVQLTEAGRVLLEHVRSAFSILDAGRERLRELSDLEGGSLRIGASDMTLRFYLLDHIAEFHRRYPAVRLTVTNAPTPRTLAALADGAIDFGVVSGPLREVGEGISLIPVRAVQDIFVAAPTHPLAGCEGITRQMLAEHPMLMLEGSTSTRAYLEEWLGRDFPPPAIELATSALLLEFAKRGLGIAPITEDFAATALASGEVVSLKLLDPLPPRDLYLAYSSRLPLSAAARRMLELLADARGEASPVLHLHKG